MKIMHVVGARPNFMKVAPIMKVMAEYPHSFEQVLVHTGQHYDAQMSDIFFAELEMPQPDEFLDVRSGTHAEQTARIMLAFEPVLQRHRPDWLIVVGDVNSTVACALVAAKCGVKIAHVEAGLRSRDRSMPEEINRVVTDSLADLLLTPSQDADENLRCEGVHPRRIYCVGNVMIDTLVKMLPRIESRTTIGDLGLVPRRYILATLHRPANVDQLESLEALLLGIDTAPGGLDVVLPAHPRTRSVIKASGLADRIHRTRLLEPLGYLDFLALMREARFVVTDSGGVQEETTFLGVPCLTVRPNTERPVTITAGTNRLVPPSRDGLHQAIKDVLRNGSPNKEKPPLWDGATAHRIVQVLLNHVSDA
jgi:UDP-N-acetylglucosamine 2-epimerase (non-hydrolysing)